MAELGHTDPGLALKIYAHAMRREDGENDRLGALVNGAELGGLGTSAHSEGQLSDAIGQSVEAGSRSTSAV
jgi:hypothetical protein